MNVDDAYDASLLSAVAAFRDAAPTADHEPARRTAFGRRVAVATYASSST
jgi:hypothetical protein